MNSILKTILSITLISLLNVNYLQAETRALVAGTDYQVMAQKGSKKPEVMEFFSYACGACYSMESFINKFKRDNSEIKVIPVPNDLGHDQWKVYVKAYYLGELLKVLDKSHEKLFYRVHVDKKQIKNEAELKDFFIALGVNENSYEKANKSFALNAKIRNAKQLAKRYEVSGTPTYIANQQFKLNNKALESLEMIEKALKLLTKINK